MAEAWQRAGGQRLRLLGGVVALSLAALPALLGLLILAHITEPAVVRFALTNAIANLVTTSVWGAVLSVVYADSMPASAAEPAADD